MIFAIDFDGTVVERGRYDDVVTPLVLKPNARGALRSLKRAGHVLILWSGRANRSLLFDATLDPLVRAGVIGNAQTDATRKLHADRLRQMLDFVERELPEVFDAIDDGGQGKVEADLYIDDRSIPFGGAVGLSWRRIVGLYGE